jgi:hypothetical protein
LFHSHALGMYKLVFDIGDHYVLAKDDEDAAWQAHNLAINNDYKLIDVIPDEKETIRK